MQISSEKFDIPLDSLSGEERMLHCIRYFRLVPRKRVVCQGYWNDSEVIAKLYYESRSARRNWKKEVEGLEAFHKHGIRAPEILHTGTANGGTIFVVLLQPVSAAQSLEEVWSNCLDETDKVAFLTDVVTILAQHHNAGLVQHDLHLKNFLSSDGKIYTLDGGSVRIQNRPLRLLRSLANLGLLFAQLYPENDRLIQPVFSGYMKHRGWQANSSTENLLRSSVIFFRRKRLKKYLKKIFRQCTEFVCEKSFRGYRVYRRILACPELNRIIDSPDASLSFPDTKILKKGNSSTVWLTSAGSHNLVIKRYNIKGIWHTLKRSVRRSRAAISWEGAHILKSHGIMTAQPIAMIEERFGIFRRRAWFISEHLKGTDACHLFNDENLSFDERSAKAHQIAKLIRQLRDYKISHGDMKATNIFFTNTGTALIDLDSVKQYRSLIFFKRPHRRDVSRFIKNWQDVPTIHALFVRLLGVNVD